MLWYALFLPPICAVMIALLQWVFYRLAVGTGKLAADDVPPFPIFIFRGLLFTLALILGITLFYKQDTPLYEDPLLTEDRQEMVKEMMEGRMPGPTDAAETESAPAASDGSPEPAPPEAEQTGN